MIARLKQAVARAVERGRGTPVWERVRTARLGTAAGARLPARRGETMPAHALRDPTGGTPPPAPRSGGAGNWKHIAASFALCVIAPFVVACIYYGLVATPQYVSEARFAVRTLSGDDVGSASAGEPGRSRLLATTPLQQDAYVVTSFIHSPAILERLSGTVDFNALFSGDDIDSWSRLDPDHTREDLEEYWNDQVETYIDGPSGIVTLRVRAFSPEDAHRLAEAILAESEELANELSERARADYIARAQAEVAAREEDYRDILARINELQNETAILDPTLRATETGTLLTNLMAQKLDVDARLFVLEQQETTDSPARRQLERTQAALEGQIQELRSQLADSGTVNSNLSETFRRFAELETDRMLTSQLYSAARRNLAQARADAIRKAVYITTFVPPAVPEESRYPKRATMPFLILAGFFVIWGIAGLTLASIEDHRT